jgi:hypothetical protein
MYNLQSLNRKPMISITGMKAYTENSAILVAGSSSLIATKRNYNILKVLRTIVRRTF